MNHIPIDIQSPRKPKIITVKKGKISAFGMTAANITGPSRSTIGLRNELEALSLCDKPLRSPVGRPVINYNDLIIIRGLLPNGMERLLEKTQPVVRRNDDRELGMAAHSLCLKIGLDTGELAFEWPRRAAQLP